MIIQFRTFEKAAQFYKACTTLKLAPHLKDQLVRAAASVALNAAEGSGKSFPKDRAKFFETAYASVKECQAVLCLAEESNPTIIGLSDELGAMLYRLVQNNRRAAI